MKKTRIFVCLLAFLMCLCIVPAYAAEADGEKNATLGDLTGNGEIDATDYMLLKRFVLGTFTLTAEQEAVADVNHDGFITAVDYMLVKRHVLGTYVIGATAPEPTGYALPMVMSIDDEIIHFIYKNNEIELNVDGETGWITLETDGSGNLTKAVLTVEDESVVLLECTYGANAFWPTKIHNNVQGTYVSLQYNTNGKPTVVSVGYQDDPEAITIHLKYNAKGNLIQQTYGESSCSYQYDEKDRLQSAVLSSDGSSVSYKYNADGTVVTGVVEDETAVIYTYDKDGNIIKIDFRNGYGYGYSVLGLNGYTPVSKAQYQFFNLCFEELLGHGVFRSPIAHFSPLF